MLNFSVNWLAVLVAAVVAFVVGAVWYMALAKPWQAGVGLSDKEVNEGMARSYGGSFVCFLIIAFVVAVVLKSLGWSTLNNALATGAVLGLVGASVTAINHLYAKKSWTLIAIDSTYQFLHVIIMAAILFWLK